MMQVEDFPRIGDHQVVSVLEEDYWAARRAGIKWHVECSCSDMGRTYTGDTRQAALDEWYEHAISAGRGPTR